MHSGQPDILVLQADRPVAGVRAARPLDKLCPRGNRNDARRAYDGVPGYRFPGE